MVSLIKQRRRKIARPDPGNKEARKRRSYRRANALNFYPLDAPGIPPPGPDFRKWAAEQGDTSEFKGSGKNEQVLSIGDKLTDLYERATRELGTSLKVVAKGNRRKFVSLIPGHLWNDKPDFTYGPKPADVMILGKMPGAEEVRLGRHLIGPSGEILLRVLRENRIKGMPYWYVTNLVKFLPPDDTTTLRAPWIKDCLPILHEELRIVRPQYILCLGTDASKALLGPEYSVTKMEGRVVEYKFPYHVANSDEPLWHTSLVMTVVHPAQVLRRPQEWDRPFERAIARWGLLLDGIRFDKEEEGVDHREVYNLDDLEAVLYEADQNCTDRVIAVDAEWHGEHPCNDGSYIRCIQISWAPKHAACIVLRHAGGDVAFEEGIEAAIAAMKKFFRNKRVVGHFFNADLEWLVDIGLDLRKQFQAPRYDVKYEKCSKREQKELRRYGYGPGDDAPAWLLTKWRGGADTGLMAHSIEETAQYKLESLSLRYTTTPRYDLKLDEWRKQWCKDHKLKAEHLEGYGECPGHILYPYANYDADVTLRLYFEFQDLLDDDYEGNCCREAFWISMRAAPAVLEMHQTGIKVSKKRADRLTLTFMEGRARQEEKIKKWANWPDFNVRSVFHVREFLFGEKYNGKVSTHGEIVKIRPQGAKSLGLEPLLDTSKRPVPWAEIKARGTERDHTPGTNKMILAILAQEYEKFSRQVNWIRDYRFVDQVLKSILRPPETDEEDNWIWDEDDGFEYSGGLASCICDDGRVRTHIYQTKETGRWSSARPPLQNISKQRDPDYKRILGAKKYKHKLRSLLMAGPGCVLIESDYSGAELYGMALMAGEMNLIRDYEQGNDIHSKVAVLSFGLDCEPSKAGLKSVPNPRNPDDPDGCTYLRIVAKSVIFGIAYGRGAKAIALAAKEQGVQITADEAQRVINTIFDMYPKLVPFFDECKRRALEDKWLCNCFGRFRRFPQTNQYEIQGEFERQAMNFPIQSLVADAMSRAIDHLYCYREDVGRPDLYKMQLQIHDAVLLEVPYENVDFVVDTVLPYCMQDLVPIYPCHLSGRPTKRGPYKLSIDTEVFKYWGEDLSLEQCQRFGLSERYAQAA